MLFAACSSLTIWIALHTGGQHRGRGVEYGGVGFCHDGDQDVEDSDGHHNLETQEKNSLDKSVARLEDVCGVEMPQKDCIDGE